MTTDEAKQLLQKFENGTITPEEEKQLWRELNKSFDTFHEFTKQLKTEA